MLRLILGYVNPVRDASRLTEIDYSKMRLGSSVHNKYMVLATKGISTYLCASNRYQSQDVNTIYQPSAAINMQKVCCLSISITIMTNSHLWPVCQSKNLIVRM